MMRWMVAILAAWLALPATAAAQPLPAQSPNLAQQPCGERETRPATIGEVIATGDAAIGQCFAIEGIALGFWLQADDTARYRLPRQENDPSSNGAMLGLYGRDRGAPPARVKIIGRIDRCERISDAVIAGGDVPFMSGYCHYYRGLALFGQRIEREQPFALTRLALRDAGALGNLRPLSVGDVRERLAAAAQPVFAALRAGDEAALRALLAAARQQQEPQTAEFLAAATASRWHRDAIPESLAVLGWVRPADASADQQARWAADAARGPEAFVCSASSEFAAASLWPVAVGDTAIAADRPYLCVQVWLPDGRPPVYSLTIARPSQYPAREP